MTNLLTIPNEILDEIVSYLDPLATSYLLISCRSLSSLISPAMQLHAVAPKHGVHALHWASRRDHLPLVQYLLTRFPVDLPNPIGGTALQDAAGSCNTRVLEHLLLNGAAINHTNKTGLTALHYACRGANGSAEATEATVRLLIAHGADVHGDRHFVPLRMALDAQLPRVVRMLLDAGASPNVGTGLGERLLIATARVAKSAELLELLLDYGADIDACNSHASNALLVAAQHGHLETVRMLVERGVNLACADHDGDTPLIVALKYDREDIAEYLVGRADADIMSGNLAGESPMDLAARAGFDAVLRALLERGASIHHLDRLGRTILHVAVMRGLKAIVHTLLENGADIETEDSTGFTALLTAIQTKNVSIVKLLLDHGADTAHSGRDGSPLMLACRCGFETILGLLLERGADANCQDQDGVSVMAWATIQGMSRAVEILAAYGGVVRDNE